MDKTKDGEIELPTADESVSTAATETTVATEQATAQDASLPLFRVEAKGLQSLEFHAIDEPEAARLFYKQHGVPSHEHNHRVTRIS
ncbi:MAG: hypothetical protein JSS49_30055 [Planctomycetes bacterium]|nr:hypothetical protein [Planctomycetota bacterium]